MMNREKRKKARRSLQRTVSLLLSAGAASQLAAPVLAAQPDFRAHTVLKEEQPFSEENGGDGINGAVMLPDSSQPEEMPEEMPEQSPSQPAEQESEVASVEEMEESLYENEPEKENQKSDDEEDDDDPGIPVGAEDNHRKSDVKLNGIDISHWQSGIDLDKVEADFVICKATGGKGYRDKSFHDFAAKILNSGRLFGFYHYANDVGYEGTPEEEAAHFYRETFRYLGKGIPVLDYEDPDLLKSGTDWALRFVNAYYSLSGVKCMIYTSSYFSRSLDWSRIAQEGYPLWIANYGKNKEQQGYRDQTYTDEYGTGAFKEYWMHQYTSNGHLEGYGGNLDLNKFFGTRDDWKSLCHQEALPDTMHRLYNPNSGEHFYTSDNTEATELAKIGWDYEGTAWIPAHSGKPVFRLYNPNAGDHHYTLSEAERDALVKAGWTYEGVGWYSDPKQGQPVYRAYNPNAQAGAHHFTTSEGEWRSLGEKGWDKEGIAWYGLAPVNDTNTLPALSADYAAKHRSGLMGSERQ